jgi:hypothetical protein
MSTKAVLETLRHAWRVLQSRDIPAAVAGGIALSAWRHVRATRDVDLLVNIDECDVDRIVSAFVEAGVRAQGSKRPKLLSDDVEILELVFEPPDSFVDVKVDLLIARSEFQKTALARRVAMPELGDDLFVLSCEDLILQKLLAGRIIDRADAAALVRYNHESLDNQYLSRWIADLALGGVFREIWKEACPSEPLPDAGVDHSAD